MADVEKSLILIVDDTPKNLQVLGSILRDSGYKVAVAQSGELALEFVQKRLPECILLDVMMPGIDGFETCRRLKADYATRDVPVLFITAVVETSEKVRAFEIGGVDYITKPFQAEEVLARVKTHAALRAMQRRLQVQNRELRRQKQEMDSDLQVAARIQQSLIPAKAPEIPQIRVAWQFIPCQYIGGDIFHIYQLDAAHIMLYLADVSGHGVAAAMLTVPIAQALSLNPNSFVRESCSPDDAVVPPADVLRSLDEDFHSKQLKHYFSLVYLVLNVQTGELRYAKGGHPEPILVRAAGTVETLDATGHLIGMNAPASFEERTLTLQPHDRLFLYTDGITECFDPARKTMYGEARLRQTLQNSRTAPLQDACQQVMTSVMIHADQDSLGDDCTLVALEYLG